VAQPPAEESSRAKLGELLHAEEVARARIFFQVIAVIVLLTAAFIPVLEGERWLRTTAGAFCLGLAAVCAGVLSVLRHPRRYTPPLAAAVGVTASLLGVGIIYYIGPFSAGVIALTVGLYFFGTSHSRLVARASYGSLAFAYLLVSAGIAAGVLEDRSLFSTVHTEPLTRWFQVLMSEVIFALTYYLARSSGRATEKAVRRATAAAIQVRTKNVLLAEAQVELASVTRPTEGSHTGKVADRYHIGELLGRGSMGEVYRGVDAEGHDAAIKILHAELVENPQRVKRFLREAEVAAAVECPHVPRVYGTGWLDDGASPYVAMEFLKGHDLGWHLRKTGRLPASQVITLCVHVSKALAHVRAAQVVHRDLKPGNLLRTESEPPVWKVLDFGLSKLLWETGSLTREYAVGTPAYMAPEQVRGKEVGHFTDLYALTAIAYRALTGIPPFSGDEVAHVLYRVMYQQPPSPAEFVRVPIDVELVLAIGLAKRPEDRFEKAEELARHLREAFAGELDDKTRKRGWALLKAHPWGSSLKPAHPSHKPSKAGPGPDRPSKRRTDTA
jgi:serine/threonine-protein kinase